MKSKNRIIIITGGSSGIGKSAADLFRANGDTVIVIARNNVDNAENFYLCDVSDEKQVKKIFEEIGTKFGRIDVLINSAGYGISGATELLPMEDVKKLFDVNVFGLMMCSSSALPFMKNGAKIINISSIMAYLPIPFRAYYAASKAAVSILSLSQRMELKSAGIAVSAVLPGQVKTNFTKNREKHYGTNDRYGSKVENAASDLDSKEDTRMSPIVAGKAIFKLANKKNPKPEIIVGGKYRLMYFVSKFVPKKAMLHVSSKISGGSN